MQRNVEPCQEAHFTMRGLQIVDDSQAVLFFDICCLYACLLAYLAAYGGEWIWLCIHIQDAFKEAAYDMIAPDIDINSLSLIEQDVIVACFDDRTDGERIAQILQHMLLRKIRHTRGYILFITGIS